MPVAGYLKLYRRKVDGFDWRKLVRRAGPLGFPMMLHIIDSTLSAYGTPSSAHISAEDFRKLTGKTLRSIRRELSRLESVGLISRDAADPWSFTPHTAAFDTAPLLIPERRPTSKERKAAVIEASRLAALRSTIALTEQSPSGEIHVPAHYSAPAEVYLPPAFHVHTDIAGRQPDPSPLINSGQQNTNGTVIHVRPADTYDRPAEMDVRPAETYCPWNWVCPFLPSDLCGDKPLKPKPLKPDAAAGASSDVDIELGESVGRSAPSKILAEPTDRPTIPLANDKALTAEVLTGAALLPEVEAVRQVICEVAVPLIGEFPTDQLCIEVHRRLKGRSLEQYRARLGAKRRAGKLNSLKLLPFLADDCARNDKWNSAEDLEREKVLRIAALARAWKEGA